IVWGAKTQRLHAASENTAMTANPESLLRHIRRLTRPALDPSADAVLLKHFVVDRNEDAFAELVTRHGLMVLPVCRRVLRDADAAGDAFQATFFVLARNAAALPPP